MEETNLAWLLRQRETDGPRLRPLFRSLVHDAPKDSETKPHQNGEEKGKDQLNGLSVAKPQGRAHPKQIPLQRLAQGNVSWIKRLHLAKKLEDHRGCVNTIQWNVDGNLIITGSDDCKVNIWSTGPRYKLLRSLTTGHSRNIFCARFVPFSNDLRFVSCGMDGEIRCTDLNAAKGASEFLVYGSHHMVLKMCFLPNSSTVFLSTHQDGTVRLFDLRLKGNSPETIIVDLRDAKEGRIATNSLALDPLGSFKFVLGCADPFVRLYDIRAATSVGAGAYDCVERFCTREALEAHRKGDRFSSVSVTGVDYNTKGEVAATYSKVAAAVFNVSPNHPSWTAALSAADGVNPEDYGTQTGVVQTYSGHCNVRTFLKEIAFMGDDNYVTTGSDCGNAFIWDKHTGEIVQLMEADGSVVNGVAPHPWLPYLATCGIDSEGKIWEPGDEITFEPSKVARVVEGNKEGSRQDEGEISITALWNFLAMLRARGGAANVSDIFGADNEDEDEESDSAAAEMELVELADRTRERGNTHFKNGEYDRAAEEYDAALAHLEGLSSQSPEVNSSKRKSSILCLLNRAACNLKRSRYQQVVDDCTKVLEERPRSIKALFRRAKAFVLMKHYEAARQDLQNASEIEPGNEEIERLTKQLEDELSAAPAAGAADAEKGAEKEKEAES